ncbi:MAG TPA: tetratricopeptide repeat protein [Caulobacteraceae bacterium]|nr:tetratricopeptide repeat protein [Caulobacteraceae bacterium]
MKGWRARLTGAALMALTASGAPMVARAQPTAAAEADRQQVVQGLQAQYEVALIRERKMADDRETQLIGALEARLKAARAQADAAKGSAAAANAQLAAARAEYDKLAGQIASRDPSTQADVAAHQSQSEAVAAQASPEKLAALQRFVDGDRVGAWPQIQALTDAELSAPGVTVAKQAADARELADLRDNMRAHGEATTADVLALYDKAAALDPSDFKTEIARARLAHDLGDLSRARAASEQAGKVAATDRERAVALDMIGEQAADQHDYATAGPDYDQAIDIFRRIVASDPTAVAQASLGGALQDKGDLQVLEGDFTSARATYSEALTIRQQVAAAHPNVAGLQDEVTSVMQRLGDLYEKTGDLAGAKGAFEDGLAIRQRLLAADPTNTDLQYYVSAFMRRLGDIALLQNDLTTARAQYEACLAIRQRLSAANPSSAQLQNAVALDLEDLAGVAYDQNDVTTARTDYEASLAIRQRLAAADPTNAALQQLILRAMARLAKTGGGSVGWREVAVQYAKIKAAGELVPGDEKVQAALKAHHLAD